MDEITKWTSKMFMKQKMGNLIPGDDDDGKQEPSEKVEKERTDLQSQRAKRDAEYAQKKAERASKKGNMKALWAANKAKK